MQPPELSATTATPPGGLPAGTRLLLTGACMVIVIAGIRAASTLLIPIFLAGLLSLLCYLPMQALHRRGVPRWLAIFVVSAGVAFSVVALVAVGEAAVSGYSDAVPGYVAKLEPLVGDVTGFLESKHVLGTAEADRIEKMIDPGAALRLVSVVTSEFLTYLSNLFVILLLMLFMLLEAQGFGNTIRGLLSTSPSHSDDLAQIQDRIAGYMTVKAGASLLTGVLVWGFTAALQIDFPILWGLFAFLFNFIPNIGAIIAAIPAIAVAMIQYDVATALVVAGGYLVINVAISALVETRLLGRRLGLSALAVLISLLFWSWVWGPIGMLLSVPLTAIVKIVFEHFDDLRPVAVLLGPVEHAGPGKPA